MSSDNATNNLPSASGTSSVKTESGIRGPPPKGYIRVQIITSDRCNEVHFQLKPTIPFARMKSVYCEKLGLNKDETRFVFDGIRITDTDTPNSLGMQNDDVIEIYQERIGGGM